MNWTFRDAIPVAARLGFWPFTSPAGVYGLAAIIGGRLEVLFVAANRPGNGQLRAFVTTAKQQYEAITFWEPTPRLAETLRRYGFTNTARVVCGGGYLLTGFGWTNAADFQTANDAPTRPEFSLGSLPGKNVPRFNLIGNGVQVKHCMTLK